MNAPIFERLLPIPMRPVDFIVFKPKVVHQHFPRRRFSHLFRHVFDVHPGAVVKDWLLLNGTVGIDYRIEGRGHLQQIHATDDFALALKFRWC